MARVLIIDMDDTLYDESSYAASGLRVVAEAIADRFPGIDAVRTFSAMTAHLAAHGRGKVFDAGLAFAGVPVEAGLVAELVQVYREHAPDIALWPGVREALDDLAQDHRLAIVTDGLGQMQRRKVAALGLQARVEAVLYCWDHDAPKPDPDCYHMALQRFGVRPQEAVVIGDRPDHDMAAAAAVGCRSIRVLTGRYASAGDQAFPADATVADFTLAPQVLRGAAFGAET
jgi:putative hydrolase of the HAD superfamily